MSVNFKQYLKFAAIITYVKYYSGSSGMHVPLCIAEDIEGRKRYSIEMRDVLSVNLESYAFHASVVFFTSFIIVFARAFPEL